MRAAALASIASLAVIACGDPTATTPRATDAATRSAPGAAPLVAAPAIAGALDDVDAYLGGPSALTAVTPSAAGAPALDDFEAYLAAAPLPDRPPPPAAPVSSIDAQRGTPRMMWAPPGDGLPLPAAAAGSPVGAARWHLARHADAYRLDAATLASIEPALVHDTGRGVIVVRLRRTIDGVELWPDRLAVVMRRDLSLIALSGGLSGAPAPRPTIDSPASAAATVKAALLDAGADPTGLAAIADQHGWRRYTAPSLAGPARVRPVLYALPDRLVPALMSEIRTAGPAPRGYRHVLADDGRLLRRQRLDAADAFLYRVWAEPDEGHRPADGPVADASPHPTGVPDGFRPPPAAPALVSVAGLDALGDLWLPDGALETRGNNVDAYADLTPPSGFEDGDLRGAATTPRRFEATYDLAADPVATASQQHAALAQLFFTINWLHDAFHDAGFDEEAGNAQHDNLGRGGVDGDRLLAEAHDYGGFNNANMFTPGDGASPVMQLFLFSAPAGGPRLDGALDATLVAHEWGHYLHHRLVDCAGALCNLMSEGWGDALALHLMLRASDPLDGVYPFAGYATLGMYPNAAYFGMRRYPYSSDLARNPLTLRHVRIGEPLPAGVPFNPLWAGNGNFEAHNAGEVWAVAVFEAYLGLVLETRTAPPRYSFAEARRRMADYIVAGMIAAPSSPTLTEQRDAILAAAATDARDVQRLAAGFARRGLGTAAVSPPASSTTGLGAVESFTIAGRLALGAVTLGDGAIPCDGDGALDVGEVGVVRVAIGNVGAAPLGDLVVAVSSPTAGVELPVGSMAGPPLAPFEQGTVAIPIGLTSAAITQLRLDVELRDPQAVVPVVTRAVMLPVNVGPDDGVECPPPPPVDAGIDAALDAGTDAEVDAAVDAAVDAGGDATVDAHTVDAPPSPPPSAEDGCCNAGPTAPAGRLAFAGLAAALLLRRRRR